MSKIELTEMVKGLFDNVKPEPIKVRADKEKALAHAKKFARLLPENTPAPKLRVDGCGDISLVWECDDSSSIEWFYLEVIFNDTNSFSAIFYVIEKQIGFEDLEIVQEEVDKVMKLLLDQIRVDT